MLVSVVTLKLGTVCTADCTKCSYQTICKLNHSSVHTYYPTGVGAFEVVEEAVKELSLQHEQEIKSLMKVTCSFTFLPRLWTVRCCPFCFDLRQQLSTI